MGLGKKQIGIWLIVWSLMILIYSPCRGNMMTKDEMNLGLIGRYGYYGEINAIEILEQGDKNYAICGTTNGLLIIDVTNPESPTKVTFLELENDEVNDIALYDPKDDPQNLYAVLACRSQRLLIFSISDIAKPFYIFGYTLPWLPKSLDIKENFLCAACGLGVALIDILDPAMPVYVGGYATQGDARDVEIYEDLNLACVADGKNGLVIIDFSNPSAPRYLGGYDDPNDIADDPNTEGEANGIAIHDDLAYVADGKNGLVVVGHSYSRGCYQVGYFDTPGDARDVAIDGNYAYIADGPYNLVILDIKDPNRITFKGEYSTLGQSNKIVIHDNLAYITNDERGLMIYDISDSERSSHIKLYEKDLKWAEGIKVQGDYAYIADGYSGLTVIGLNDPNSPVKRETDGYCLDLDIDANANYAYIADYDGGLAIIDINDPNLPYLPFNTGGRVRDIVVRDHYAYVADEVKGLLIYGISNPDDIYLDHSHSQQLGSIAIHDEYVYAAGALGYNLGIFDIGHLDANGHVLLGNERTEMPVLDIAVSEDGSTAYAAIGYRGIVIFDVISNSNQPIRIGGYNTEGKSSGIALHGNYAFVADGPRGLVALDISDPNSPRYIGTYFFDGAVVNDVCIDGDNAYVPAIGKGLYVVDISDPEGAALVGEFKTLGKARKVISDGDYAYLVSDNKGFEIINIRDPNKPLFTGGYDTDGWSYDIALKDNYAYVADGPLGLAIFDITNPNCPAFVGAVGEWWFGESRGVALGDDGNYAFLAQMDRGLTVIDISDPNFPHFVNATWYKDPNMSRDAQGIAIGSDHAFMADANNGLVIIGYDSDSNHPEKYKDANQFYLAAHIDTLGTAYDVDYDINLPCYVFVADGEKGISYYKFQDPCFQSTSCLIDSNSTYDTRGTAYSLFHYANGGYNDYRHSFYVADGDNGIVVVGYNDAEDLLYRSGYSDTPGTAYGLYVDGNRNQVYVADGEAGLGIYKIIETPPVQGNLIICSSGPASSYNPIWSPSNTLANQAYSVFRAQGYPDYFIYYLTPDPYQDIDKDGIPDQLVVDDFDPGINDLKYVLTDWAYNRLNTGPLYFYLNGLGRVNEYQIMPSEILQANDFTDPHNSLKSFLDEFQNRTNRQTICILEFSSSGSFCSALIDPDTEPYTRTIIACTAEETSFLDLTGKSAFTGQFLDLLENPNLPEKYRADLFAETDNVSLEKRLGLLQGLFSEARQKFWRQGHPFNTQPPQMVTAEGHHTLCAITLVPDPNQLAIPDPNQLVITDPNQRITLQATGHYLDSIDILSPGQLYFQSSDSSILGVNQDGVIFANPNASYNGTATILATIIDSNFVQSLDDYFIQSPDHDTNIPLLGGVTGRISIEVRIPGYGEKSGSPKAIIVAGTCEDEDDYDYLWETTKKMADHAYDTLKELGYSDDNIYYLSHDTNNMKVNTPSDDPNNDPDFFVILQDIFIDSDPNNTYFNSNGVEDLTIFLIDHGKLNRFILGPDDEKFLSPLDLDYWLDTFQKKNPNSTVTVIIEACHSGCFIAPLKEEEYKRIIITSTQDNVAYLAANGLVSFSYFLFNYLKSGASFANAYQRAQLDIASLSWSDIQKPALEDDPNRNLASKTLLGRSFILSQDQPYIITAQCMTAPPIGTGASIDLQAKVMDLDGIKSVWAVISESQSSLPFSGFMNKPITEGMETVEMSDPNKTGYYKGTYTAGFAYSGLYTLLFFAEDNKGMVSYPKAVQIYVQGDNQEKGIIIYDDPNYQKYAETASWILGKRRFSISEDSIKIIDDKSIDDFSYDTFDLDSNSPLDHLLLYFVLQDPNNLDSDKLDDGLDAIQTDTNCTAIIIIDSDYSGRFIDELKGDTGQRRIIITSTDPNNPINKKGKVQPFSQFFFSGIYNGANVNRAFHSAWSAIKYFSPNQNPWLEDNPANNDPNNDSIYDGPYYYGPDYDGKLAERVYLGSPFEAIEAGPRITVPAVVHINGWETSAATIWAEVPDPNSSLWAVIDPPSGATGDKKIVHLAYDPNTERFQAEYNNFTQQGVYNVVVYAEDGNGLIDYDQSPYIVLKLDEYEDDDIPRRAKPIIVNKKAQTHSFHHHDDIDWLHLYAYKGRVYEIKVTPNWTDCPIRIDVFGPDGNNIGDSPYRVGFTAEQEGLYLVKVSYTCPHLPEVYPEYDIDVTCPSGGNLGGLWGYIKDRETEEGIIGARISLSDNTSCVSLGGREGFFEDGFYITPLRAPGDYTMTIDADHKYQQKFFSITILPNFYEQYDIELELDSSPEISLPEPSKNDYDEALELNENRKMIEITLFQGLNIFAKPNADPSGPHHTAGDFMDTYGMEDLNDQQKFYKMIQYDPDTGLYETCPAEGNDHCFPLFAHKGVATYMLQDITFTQNSILVFNPAIDLKKGINWVGIPNPPEGYTSFTMLRAIGIPEEIRGIACYDPYKGKWRNTYWCFNRPSGDDFPIQSGHGYVVIMEKDRDGWVPGIPNGLK